MNRFYRCRRSAAGFTLPIVTGTGSVMVLIAAALISNAQSGQTIANMQSKSERASNAAEIGVTRLQSYLARQRLLATQNSTQWATVMARLNAEIGSCPTLFSDNAQTTGQSYAQGEWLEAGQADQQYRMLSYAYQPQPGSNGQIGVATLTVEGRVTSGLSPAVSRLAVEIPIAIASSPPSPPALWAQNFNLSNTAQITGDVRAQRCPDLTDADRVPGITSANLAMGDSNQPSGTITAAADPLWPLPFLAPASALSVPVIRDDLTLPRVHDLPDAQGNFDYIVDADSLNNSIQLADDQKITIKVEASQTVNLYTRGNIDIGGGQVIVNVIGDPQPHPEKLRIYGSDRTLQFSIKDSAKVMAFIHAPLAAGIAWATPTVGTGITGGLWLQQWDTASHNSRLPIRQMGRWHDLVRRPTEQLGLQLQPISRWQRQEQD
jgi:hypothetical protein